MFIITLSDIFDIAILGVVVLLLAVGGVVVVFSKIAEYFKDNRTQAQKDAEEATKKEAEEAERERANLLKERSVKKQKAWAKKHPHIIKYLDFQSRHTILMTIIYTVFILVVSVGLVFVFVR